MAEPAGNDFAVFEPRLWWGLVGTPLVGPGLPFGSNMPAGYNRILDTINGIMVTMRNPRVPINSDERGRLGDVRGDDDGIAIGFDVRTPTIEFVDLVSSMEKVAVAAQAAVTGPTALPAVPAFNVRKLNPRKRKPRLFLCFEGMAEAGTLFDEDTAIRAFAYRASTTGNAEHIFRSRGADSVFHSAVTLECLPSQILPAQLAGSRIPASALDQDGKFDYIDWSLEAA